MMYLIKQKRYLAKWWMALGVLMLGNADLSAYTIDWSTLNWSQGSLNNTATNVNGSEVDLTLKITGNTSDFNSGSPDYNSQYGIDYYVNFGSSSNSVTTTLSFSTPVKISFFRIIDVDYSTNNFDDRVIITGKDRYGNTVYPNNVVLGSDVQENAPGDYESTNVQHADTDTEAYVTVEFSDTAITEISYTYAEGDTAPNDPTSQGVYLADITFEPLDTDGDGVPDFKDLDSDNDGILDAVEYPGSGPQINGAFLSHDDGFYILDSATGTLRQIGVVDAATTYNGIAYNPDDGQLYGISREATSYTGTDGRTIDKNDIIIINRTDGTTRLAGDTNGSFDAWAADIENGVMYILESDGSKITTYDIESHTVTGTITLSSQLAGAWDIAVLNGVGYVAHVSDTSNGNGYLYQIDLATGDVTRRSLNYPGANSKQMGGMYFSSDSNGNIQLYAVNNGFGTFRIDDFDTASPSAVRTIDSGAIAKNDAATYKNGSVDPKDTDGDGIPDYLDLDSDNDGIPDNIEGQSTTGYVAPSGNDADGDGLDDAYDNNTSGTNNSVGVSAPDSDRDGSPDFVDTDSDNDGYTDCEEGISADQAPNCPRIGDVGSNGLMDGLESGGNDQGYGNVNNGITNPNPDNGSNDILNEYADSTNQEAGYREFMCGKATTTLTRRNWKLISIPCNTGSVAVETLFYNDLGPYGEPADGGQWVMYKQSGTDNYETNTSHDNTEKLKLSKTDTLEQGVGYWIIWDDGQGTAQTTLTVTIQNGLAPTTLSDARNDKGLDDLDFNKIYAYDNLPNNDMSVSGNYKKFIAGNPFIYAFKAKNLYFSHGAASGTYNPLGDSANDNYIDAILYKHDSSDLSDQTTANGGGYEPVDVSTPGFANGGIKAMEAFFMEIKEVNDGTNNSFAFPLVQRNGNGN